MHCHFSLELEADIEDIDAKEIGWDDDDRRG